MSRILCRISGAPRSASAIASGHSGSAGHAIADKCNGSTNRGDCKQEWEKKMQSVVHQHNRQVKKSIHNNYSEMQHPT
jgi:hypothetical protein